MVCRNVHSAVIDDNIDACVNAFYQGQAINDVMNIGSDKEITILDLAKKLLILQNQNSRIVFLPPLEEGDMLRRIT